MVERMRRDRDFLFVSGKPIDIPAKAPALWKERDKNDYANPADFILQHYAAYLGPPNGIYGLTRADIRRLDFHLYRTLMDWLVDERSRNSKHWLALKDRLPTLASRNERIATALERGQTMPDLPREKVVSAMLARKRKDVPSRGESE